MATIDVLDGVRDVMATVTGVVTSYRGIPRRAPGDAELPCCITRWNVEGTGVTEVGALETWSWPIRVDLLYAQGNDLWAVEAALLPFVEAVIEALQRHQTLKGSGAIRNPVTWRPQLIALWDTTYAGLAFLFSAENYFERASIVAP